MEYWGDGGFYVDIMLRYFMAAAAPIERPQK
jgi:hypothetical protein